jgi:hypothetical protein
MSDPGFVVPGMTETPGRYDVTITVDHGGVAGLHRLAAAAVALAVVSDALKPLAAPSSH